MCHIGGLGDIASWCGWLAYPLLFCYHDKKELTPRMTANCGSRFEATDYHGMEVMARETWHPCHTVPSQEAAGWRLMLSFWFPFYLAWDSLS